MNERPSVPLAGVNDEFDDGEIVDDDYDIDEEDPGAECGRWRDSRLTKSCSKAGSEECDFECPYRDGLYRTVKTRRKKAPEVVARDPRTLDMFEEER